MMRMGSSPAVTCAQMLMILSRGQRVPGLPLDIFRLARTTRARNLTVHHESDSTAHGSIDVWPTATAHTHVFPRPRSPTNPHATQQG